MARRRLVSAEIWAGHYGAPLDEREIARHYTLTGDDLEIVGRRRGDATRLQDVLLVSPSPEYLESLPDRKLPDRKDFERYIGDDAGRERAWRKAIAESDRLGDEFMELVESGRLKDVIRPLDGKR